jgi:molybdopterin synthase sulfur carrier subunit
MRVTVKGYLTLRALMGNQPFIEILDEGITVRDLLGLLSEELGDLSAHLGSSPAAAAVTPPVLILVNGRHCSHLPHGLETRLVDGDEVSIFPPIAGG